MRIVCYFYSSVVVVTKLGVTRCLHESIDLEFILVIFLVLRQYSVRDDAFPM